MIDLHCHLLPGVDDGPETMEDAVALARAAVATGTTAIVATPHVDAHWDLRPSDTRPRLAAVREALTAAGVPLEVHPGAEVALDRYLDLDDGERDAARMGDGPYLLLEAPLSQASGSFDTFLASLLGRGVRMVIAHPERCPAFQRAPERLARLVASGALAQVTAGSLSGRFGDAVRHTALDQVRDGLVHVIASDAHSADRRRPDLREGIDAMTAALPGSEALVEWMTLGVPRAVLDGTPVPRRPAVELAPARRPRLLDRLLGRTA